MVGDNIEVSVVEILGDHIRLGITAPTQVTIHRKEVYLRVLEENLAATAASQEDVSKLLGAPAATQAKPATPSFPRRKPKAG
jgi:carbon storage regulator